MEVKKDKGRRVEHKVIPFVTGLHSLPESGGMLDQPHRLMTFFRYFEAGENLAAFKKLNK